MVLRKLEDNGILTPKATQLFHNIRKTGNKAVHQLTGDKGEALYNSLMDGYPFGNDWAYAVLYILIVNCVDF